MYSVRKTVRASVEKECRLCHHSWCHLQLLQHEVRLHGGIKQNHMVASIRITRGTLGPGADSISCLVGQDFLGKCVPPDTFSWQTDFPPTPYAYGMFSVPYAYGMFSVPYAYGCIVRVCICFTQHKTFYKDWRLYTKNLLLKSEPIRQYSYVYYI